MIGNLAISYHPYIFHIDKLSAAYLFVTCLVKTLHILPSMKINIRPEISISMCNCAVVKKWKQSVA